MRIFKRPDSPYWYIEIQRGKSKSLRTTDRAAAEKALMEQAPKCAYCQEKRVKKYGSKYCSGKCRNMAYSEIYRFGQLRRKILERFGNACGVCGWEDDLHIHHIDGSGDLIRNQINNDENNLIVLCPECHRWVHGSFHIEDPGSDVVLSLDTDGDTFRKKAILILRSALERTKKLHAECAQI